MEQEIGASCCEKMWISCWSALDELKQCCERLSWKKDAASGAVARFSRVHAVCSCIFEFVAWVVCCWGVLLGCCVVVWMHAAPKNFPTDEDSIKVSLSVCSPLHWRGSNYPRTFDFWACRKTFSSQERSLSDELTHLQLSMHGGAKKARSQPEPRSTAC